MSATDRLTIVPIVRPAKVTNTPPGDFSTPLPIVLVLIIIALNAIASIGLVLSGIDLSALFAM
jgi:hypothetical protein